MAIDLVSVTKTIDAPIDEIWAIISSWGSERLWFPNVIKSSLQGHGVGSIRTLVSQPDDVTVPEELEVVDPESHTIVYKVLLEHDKFEEARGTMKLDKLENGQTQFKWSAVSKSIEDDFKPELQKKLEDMYSGAMDSIGKILG